MAEKSLKKKYGEEFIIHNVWERDQTRFFADCSPKDNPRAVFLASIYKNGGGVFDDEYAEAVVALEVDDILRDGFEEAFENCYVKSHVSKFYTRPEFESPKILTLEEYLEATDTRIMCYVFADNSNGSEKVAEREYRYLSEILPQKVEEGGIGDNIFDAMQVYFTDEEMVKESEEYFLLNTDIRGEFDSKTYKCNWFFCSYQDKKISKSYEEYLEKRIDDGNETTN
ncbi:MAG: hypothetical protein NC398_13930 [Acetatifactor muris]|nr:hypothetical protein [Acetatifactor muris]